MSTKDRIRNTLQSLFTKHRIITWHDEKAEMRERFTALQLDGVEKIEIDNNEFGVKLRILKQEPNTKFLLYRAGPLPPDEENWLLDIELGFPIFHADQASLWLAELGLGPAYLEIVTQHRPFFEETELRKRLQSQVNPEISGQQFRLEMLAVCVEAEARVPQILLSLLDQSAKKQTQSWELIQACHLDGFFMGLLEAQYGYTSQDPTLKDFVFTLFASAYARGLGERAALNNDAMVFLQQWQDSQKYQHSFRIWSDTFSQLKNIEEDLLKRDYRELVNVYYFKVIDQKILGELVREVENNTISSKDLQEIIEKRRFSIWFNDYEPAYLAVSSALTFFRTLKESDFSIRSIEEGFEKYSQSWFLIDQYYRKYIFNHQRLGITSLFEVLNSMVEKFYQNNYLLALSGAWQQVMEDVDRWPQGDKPAQRFFYTDQVEPFLLESKKVFVVISDALRYEIAHELVERIKLEERYEASLNPMWGMLPSYTQLGMAALLPNQKLAFTTPVQGTIDIDGQSSMGTSNRSKILAGVVPNGGLAMRMDEFTELNASDARALIRDNDVIYFYHNRIDSTGDKQATENKVFDAVDDTLYELKKFLWKLIMANANNILITADHGFIYQNRPIDESEYASVDVEGSEIYYKDRRFALGKGLVDKDSLMKFSARAVGIDSDVEVQIPKANNRLRLSGAGSRFVHGGASLQELVLPVIHVHRLRTGEVRKVEVDVLDRGSHLISTGQFSITLYQREPVEENIHPRHLRIGLYDTAGVLISDRHEVICNSVSENSREREYPLKFILTSQAESANNQDVLLKLEEPVPQTTHYHEYKTIRYLLQRSITSDFDF